VKAALRLAAILPAALLLTACLHAPEDYDHSEVSRYDIKPLTLTDMEKVIRRAAFIEEWQKVDLVEPGHLVATRYQDAPIQGPKKWVATVDILYTPSDFSIHYKSSTNLGYDPYTHIIGHKYQSIVKDLAGRIQDIARVTSSSAKD
jgi:hypothetical protein